MWYAIMFALFAILLVTMAMPKNQEARRLNKKFVSLGDMKGKTYQEIASVVGECDSRQELPDGTVLCQWVKPGYLIAIVFDSSMKMVRISNEINTIDKS